MNPDPEAIIEPDPPHIVHRYLSYDGDTWEWECDTCGVVFGPSMRGVAEHEAGR